MAIVKCIILDDELPGLSYLKGLCEQNSYIEVVKAFTDPLLLLQQIDKLEFDLLITDIEMPEVSGIELADRLIDRHILFVTAYKQFAIEAFDRNAVDYILKPIRPERFNEAIQRAVARINSEPKKGLKIHLATDQGKTQINTDTILCIMTSEIDSRDKIIIFRDTTSIIAKNISFDSFMEILPGNMFCRINKKTIIAVASVKLFTSQTIISNIRDSKGDYYTFNLTEKYRQEFRRLAGN